MNYFDQAREMAEKAASEERARKLREKMEKENPNTQEELNPPTDEDSKKASNDKV